MLAFVRELGANGLLEGVELPAPELPDWFDVEPAPELEPGDELDDFTLTDLDGVERSAVRLPGQARAARQLEPRLRVLREDRRRARCAASAPRRARGRAPLRDARRRRGQPRGVRSSSASLHPRCCATAPTSIRSREPARLPRTCSTSDGRLVETMVVGADQVPSLARDLAGVDPATQYGVTDDVVDDDDEDLADDDVRGKYLPAPGAMCGPGGGAGASNSTDWTGTRAYALGEYHVGLRYDDVDTADGARPTVRGSSGQRPARARQLLGRARRDEDHQGSGRIAIAQAARLRRQPARAQPLRRSRARTGSCST